LIARKGLGQHFLQSSSAVNAIVTALSEANGILEIGPGPGVLTSALSETHPVIALEVDDAMIAALAESAPKAQVRKADALNTDMPTCLTTSRAPLLLK